MHVLRASAGEFKQMERKQKLPKPKVTAPVIDMAIDLLQARLKRYPTSLDVSWERGHTRVRGEMATYE